MRIFRLIATPVILLGLLGVLVWGATWGWRSLTAPLPSRSPTPCVTISTQWATPAHVTVRVFNAGATGGLANRVATQLRDRGFIVTKTDNSDERVTKTTIRTNKAYVPQIRLVQSQFKNAVVVADDRVDGTVDVLLPTEFPGYGEKPASKVTANGGKLCVPPPKSPSPSPSASPSPSPSK